MRTLVDEFPQAKTFFQAVGFGMNVSAIALASGLSPSEPRNLPYDLLVSTGGSRPKYAYAGYLFSMLRTWGLVDRGRIGNQAEDAH
jgi:hypothetical protein